MATHIDSKLFANERYKDAYTVHMLNERKCDDVFS